MVAELKGRKGDEEDFLRTQKVVRKISLGLISIWFQQIWQIVSGVGEEG